MRRYAIVGVLLALTGAAAFAALPLDTWTSSDGHVRVVHPPAIAPSGTSVVGNYFFGPGWRVFWNGPDPFAKAGRVVVSFGVKVRPSQAHESASELLQIGVSHSRRVIATCLTSGMQHGENTALPDQTINGVTFAAYSNSDQSMSQGATTLDLRAVVGNACYTIDRITETAGSDPDSSVTLGQSRGAAELDAMLASVQISE